MIFALAFAGLVAVAIALDAVRLRRRERLAPPPSPREVEDKIRSLESPHWANPWEDGWHEDRLICRASCCSYTKLGYAVAAGALTLNEYRNRWRPNGSSEEVEV